jgi:hypothetical protein
MKPRWTEIKWDTPASGYADDVKLLVHKNKLHGPSPRANYTGRATTAFLRS